MGNMRCKNCSEEYSSKEKACPSCGEKRPAGGKRVKKSKISAAKIIAAVVLIVLLVIVGILLVKVLGNNNSGDNTADGGSIIQQDDSTGAGDAQSTDGGSATGDETTDQPALESVALDITEVTLRDGENTAQLSATTYPENSDAQIQWASSDPAVAAVDDNGFVTGVGQGTAEIYAYCEDKIAVCNVYSYVTSAPSNDSGTNSEVSAGNLEITSIYSSNSVEDMTLKQGESVQLYLNNDGAKVTDGISWTSDSAAVTVDDSGQVSANYAISGYATITASYGGNAVEVIVRVK